MIITATVCTYWPRRRDNVTRIVRDLLAGSMVPDHIVVLDNNVAIDAPTLPDDPRVSLVTSTENTWTRGKFVAALFHPANYYLMMDDDTSVGPGTVARLANWSDVMSPSGDDMVTGYWGVTLNANDRGFMTGTIHGHDTTRAVDGFHGRAMWMGHQAMARMIALEGHVRIRYGHSGVTEMVWPHEGDDIIAGLANEGHSYTLPMAPDQYFVDLDQCGEALQFQADYFGSRDDFTRDALGARQRWHDAENR
jgi:hypothetical protein